MMKVVETYADPREDRKDALWLETDVLCCIRNLQVLTWRKAGRPGDVDSWGIEVTQAELAKQCRVGKRTLERICDRLVKLGRLRREDGKGRAAYLYNVTGDAVEAALFDLALRQSVFCTRTDDGMIGLQTQEEYFAQFFPKS